MKSKSARVSYYIKYLNNKFRGHCIQYKEVHSYFPNLFLICLAERAAILKRICLLSLHPIMSTTSICLQNSQGAGGEQFDTASYAFRSPSWPCNFFFFTCNPKYDIIGPVNNSCRIKKKKDSLKKAGMTDENIKRSYYEPYLYPFVYW